MGLLAFPLARPGAAEFQFEDNIRELFDSAKSLMAQDDLEEAALEYENVLQIDPNHRDAALALHDVYLKLGASVAAEELMGRFGRMGVDSAQVSALRAKLDAVKASPPPKRKRVFTAAAPPPVAAPGGANTLGTPQTPGDDLLDDLDAPPAPRPPGGAPAAPPMAPASPGAPAAPGAKDALDDLSL